MSALCYEISPTESKGNILIALRDIKKGEEPIIKNTTVTMRPTFQNFIYLCTYDDVVMWPYHEN